MQARKRGFPKAEHHSWKARFRVLIVAIIVVVGLLASLFLGRFFHIRELRHELSTLMQQERAALADQDELRKKLSLKDDPQAIEEKARELFGLVKPNEEKVIFIEGD